MTAVIPLTMVVVGSKQPLNHHRPRPPHMGHCKSRQQPCKTNRCNAEPPTRTTYGTTRPYQTLHRSYQLTNGVSQGCRRPARPARSACQAGHLAWPGRPDRDLTGRQAPPTYYNKLLIHFAMSIAIYGTVSEITSYTVL